MGGSMTEKTYGEAWREELDVLLSEPVYAVRKDSDGIEYQEDVRPVIVAVVGRLLKSAVCTHCEGIAPQCGGGSGPDCDTFLSIERSFK